jgi:hypothetical protein
MNQTEINSHNEIINYIYEIIKIFNIIFLIVYILLFIVCLDCVINIMGGLSGFPYVFIPSILWLIIYFTFYFLRNIKINFINKFINFINILINILTFTVVILFLWNWIINF